MLPRESRRRAPLQCGGYFLRYDRQVLELDVYALRARFHDARVVRVPDPGRDERLLFEFEEGNARLLVAALGDGSEDTLAGIVRALGLSFRGLDGIGLRL